MKCDYHPEREIVDVCVGCGRGICELCKTIIDDKSYCPNCTGKNLADTDKPHIPIDSTETESSTISIEPVKKQRKPIKTAIVLLLLVAIIITLGTFIYLKNSDLNATRSELLTYQSNLSRTQADLLGTQNNLSNIESNLSKITSGYRYVLNDPTSDQVTAFLASDTTDQNIYNEETYNSFNFAADMIVNASEQHIRCGFVYVLFPNSSCPCVVFNTIDKGLHFIEPISDDIVNLQVGNGYWESMQGQNWSTPAYNDTVVSYTIIW